MARRSLHDDDRSWAAMPRIVLGLVLCASLLSHAYAQEEGGESPESIPVSQDWILQRQLGEPILRHPNSICAVGFFPDNERVMSAGGRFICIWDGASGKLLKQIGPTLGCIQAAVISPDGSMILTGHGSNGYDPVARLWDAETGKLLHTWSDHETWVEAVAFTPDGSRVVTIGIGDDTLRVRDIESKETVRQVKVKGIGWHLALSPDGKTAYADSDDGIVAIDLTDGTERLRYREHKDRTVELAVSMKGTVASARDGLRLWDGRTGKTILSIQNEKDASVGRLTFAPDSQRFLWSTYTRSDSHVQICAAATGLPVLELPHRGHVGAAAFSRDGKKVVTACFAQLQVWDAGTGRVLSPNADAPTCGWGICLSPRGDFAATSAEQGWVHVWELASGRMLRSIQVSSEWNSAMAFSPDGSKLVTGGTDPEPGIRFWDLATGKRVAEWTGPARFTSAIAFSADGRRLAVSSGYEECSIHIFDAETGHILKVLKRKRVAYHALAWHPNNVLLFAAAEREPLQLWNTVSGARLEWVGRKDEEPDLREPIRTVFFSVGARAALVRERTEMARLTHFALPLREARELTPAGRQEVKEQIERWRSDDFEVRDAGTTRLLAFGESARELVEALCSDADGEVRARALAFLGKLDQAQLPVFVDCVACRPKLSRPTLGPNGEWAVITWAPDGHPLNVLVGALARTREEISAGKGSGSLPEAGEKRSAEIQWEWATHPSYQEIQTAFPPESLAFSPDGSKLIIGNCNGTLSVYTRRK